jgi:hypothetical protein
MADGVDRVSAMDDDAELFDLVDLVRYPLTDLSGPTGHAVIADARTQLAAIGAAELHKPRRYRHPGRRRPGPRPPGHHSGGEATAYLEFPDFSLPKDHPADLIDDEIEVPRTEDPADVSRELERGGAMRPPFPGLLSGENLKLRWSVPAGRRCSRR